MLNVTMFGTVFMDIKGFAEQNYDPVGRNLGHVKFIHGGVGRNVAENLGILGVPTTFVSTVDDNANGQEIENRLLENEVKTDYLKKVPADGMGMWMALLAKHGELVGSISKMPNLQFFADIVNNQGEEIITKASHVALDIDLNEEITKKVIAIAKEKNKPIYGLPGNLSVILNNKDLLKEMECFVCNDIEAAKIFAVEIELGDVAKITAELTKFAKCHNIKAMVVTMGEKGAVYFCRGMEQAQYHSVQPVEMVDSTGAGDAFFSGTISALVQGKSIDVAVEYGSKVAAHTIQSLESTCCGFIKD